MTLYYHELVLLWIQMCTCFGGFQVGARLLWFKWGSWKAFAAAGGISSMGKSIRNASNLKTWFLAKKKTEKTKKSSMTVN